MILLELKHYIKHHKQVPSGHLMRRFNLSKEALDGLIKPLLQQGYIYRQTLTAQTCTNHCQKACPSHNSDDYFFWSDHPVKPLLIDISVTP